MEQKEHRQKKRRSYHQKEKKKKQRSDNRILLENRVLEEVLSRLPVKSLLRFMCVSKHWKSLISSYSFRKLHRQRHNSSPPLLLAYRNSVYDEGFKPGILLDYHLTAFDLYGKIVQQFNLPISSEYLRIMHVPHQSKLVCFADSSTMRYFSYNPSTRQFFRLPNPPCFSLPDFKLRTSHFGYFPSKDEYMFVHVVDKSPLDTWVCEVLTMSISNDNFQLHYNEWRSIEVTTKLRRVCLSYGVFVCGDFYWDARDENDNNCILCFDVETETFSILGFPQGVPFAYRTLFEIKDELYLMHEADEGEEPPILDLWKLSSDVNDKKLWTLYWNINLQSLGYEVVPDSVEFDWTILINRLEYLKYYDKPFNILREMGKLRLEDDDNPIMLEEDEDYFMPRWCLRIHTNLFTL